MTEQHMPLESAMNRSVSTSARSSDWLPYLLQPDVLKRNLMIAVIVGTLLTIINQLDVVLREGLSFRLATKIVANFAIPFLVSSSSALINRRSHCECSGRVYPRENPPSPKE
jgi:hypothetical protein